MRCRSNNSQESTGLNPFLLACPLMPLGPRPLVHASVTCIHHSASICNSLYNRRSLLTHYFLTITQEGKSGRNGDPILQMKKTRFIQQVGVLVPTAYEWRRRSSTTLSCQQHCSFSHTFLDSHQLARKNK